MAVRSLTKARRPQERPTRDRLFSNAAVIAGVLSALAWAFLMPGSPLVPYLHSQTASELVPLFIAVAGVVVASGTAALLVYPWPRDSSKNWRILRPRRGSDVFLCAPYPAVFSGAQWQSPHERARRTRSPEQTYKPQVSTLNAIPRRGDLPKSRAQLALGQQVRVTCGLSGSKHLEVRAENRHFLVWASVRRVSPERGGGVHSRPYGEVVSHLCYLVKWMVRADLSKIGPSILSIARGLKY